MKYDDYERLNTMTDIWMDDGKREAIKDFKDYQKGKITKQDLKHYCYMAKMFAAFADYEGQCKGAGYLEQMEILGFIKDLHVDD